MKRFLLLLLPLFAALGAESQVIISQYYEGASSDKWIEITNVGAAPVDLASPQLYLALFSNAAADNPGSSTASQILTLTGTIASGESFLYKNGSAALPTAGNITGSPTTATALCNFNGDDLVILSTSNSGTAGVVWAARTDVVGNGTGWGSDISLYRNSSVITPNTTFDQAGEWTSATNAAVNSAAVGTTQRLGFHDFVSGGGCSATPTDGATAPASPGQTDATIDLSWTAGTTGDNYVVVALQGATPTAATASTLDGDDFTGTFNADFTLAPDLDGVAAQGKVVYAGPATTATVSGLTASTSYTFRIYHYCSNGGAELYNYANTVTLTQSTTAPPSIGPGDILFVAYASDDPDELAFFTFVDIPGGTVLYITDNGWNGSSLEATEGTLEWTAPSTGIAAGNSVKIFDLSGTPTPDLGSVTEVGSFAPNTTQEQFIMYTGSAVSPDFITGLSSGVWETPCPGSVTSEESCVPGTLIAATTGEVHEGFLAPIDNGYFDPALAPGFPVPPASIAEAKEFINDRDYWTRNDSPIDPGDWDINPWDDYFGPAIPCPSVQATDLVFSDIRGTSATISWTAGTGGDNYLVIVNEGSAATFDPTDGDDPATAFGTVSTNYSLATDLGGGRVVAYTPATTVTISGLSISSNYYVRVVHVQSTGPYCYANVTTATNDGTQTFTTLAFDPVVLVEWTFPNGSADALVDVASPNNVAQNLTAGPGLGALGFGSQGADGAGDFAASANGWTETTPAPPANDYFQFSVNTDGFWSNLLHIKFAGSGDAPQQLRVRGSINGGTTFVTLVDAANLVNDATDFTTSQVSSFILPGAFSDNPNVVIRIEARTATTLDGTAFDGTDALLIDDILVESRPIYYRTIADGSYETAANWEIADNPAFTGATVATQAPLANSEIFATIQNDMTLAAPRSFGNNSSPTVGSLTITSAGSLDLQGFSFDFQTINSSLIMEVGATITDGGGGNTLTMAGGSTFETKQATLTSGIDPLLDVAACDTFIFSGTAAQTTGISLPGSIGKLEIDNAAGVTLSADLDIADDLVLTSGALNISGRSLTVSGPITAGTGTLTTDAATLLILDNTGSVPTPLPFTAGAVTIGALGLQRAESFTLGNDVTVDVLLDLSNNAELTLNGNSLAIADISATAGAFITPDAAASLTVNGLVSLSGGDFPFSAGDLSLANLIINADELSLAAGNNLTVGTALDLSGGGELTLNANTLTLNGSATFAGGTLNADVTSSIAIGATAAAITLPANVTDLLNLSLASSNGVTLSANLTLANTGILTLTDGALDLGTNTLAITNPAVGAISGGSASTYVTNGTLQRTTNSTNPYVFPVGSNTPRYREVVITPSTGGDTYSVEYREENTTGAGFSTGPGYLTLPLQAVSDFEYYQIDNGGGADLATVRLTYGPGTYGDPLNNEASLVVAHRNGASWESVGGTVIGTIASGTVTSNPTNSFSPFAIGSTDALNFTPLPVELLSFSGERVGADVQLYWNTASELNNDRYEIQRSANPSFESFDMVGTVAGQGTTNEITEYSFLDREVATAQVWYYRLRQVDYDGTATLTDAIEIAATEQGAPSLTWSLKPNPSTGSDVDLLALGQNVEANASVAIQVIAADGRVVLQARGAYAQVRAQLLEVLRAQPAGTYVVSILYAGFEQHIRHIRY